MNELLERLVRARTGVKCKLIYFSIAIGQSTHHIASQVTDSEDRVTVRLTAQYTVCAKNAFRARTVATITSLFSNFSATLKSVTFAAAAQHWGGGKVMGAPSAAPEFQTKK